MVSDHSRILVFGDSNSWGTPADGSDLRIKRRWPVVMADHLGCGLVEDCLPGRTTVHDDPQMAGAVQNGLRHLPVTLYAQRPLDLVLIMLGTNDMKTRFDPSADGIATNLARLADCIVQHGGGPGAWGDLVVPRIAFVVPMVLGPAADDPAWERYEEWLGGRAASLHLATCLRARVEPKGHAVFEASDVVEASALDPIHLDPESHIALGHAIAEWVAPMLEQK